jgi:hypothetical protein
VVPSSSGAAVGRAGPTGVHIGECDLAGDSGPIVEISAGIAEAVGAGDVWVSRTVVDLVPGRACNRGSRRAAHRGHPRHSDPRRHLPASRVERSPA